MTSETDRARANLLRMVSAAQEQPRTDKSGQMFEVIQAMNRDLNPETLFPNAIQKVLHVFQAERAFLILGRDPDALRFQTAATFDGARIEHPEEEISHAVIREVAAGRRAVRVVNALHDNRFVAVSSVMKLELLSVMCAPLLVENELLGVVYMDNRALPGSLSEADLELLALFAGHAAIAIRNAQLFEELRQAREALLQAERLKAVGELAAYIAHEIRSPITSMQIMAEELPNQYADPEFRQTFVEIFSGETQRMIRSADELLNYARPSKLELCEMSLPDLLDSVLIMFEPTARRDAVQINREYPADLSPLVADPQKLTDVIRNLVKNAMEAVAKAETKCITVSAHVDGDTIVLRVSDTGLGISEDILEKLFQPYASGKSGGTGLGLANSAKIVAEHGGTIKGENRPEGGAQFTVCLPLAGANPISPLIP